MKDADEGLTTGHVRYAEVLQPCHESVQKGIDLRTTKRPSLPMVQERRYALTSFIPEALRAGRVP